MCPVHQFVFQDGVLKAKELINRIGRVVHMEGTFCSAGGMGLSGEQLDNIMWDILPHPLSLMQAFLPGDFPPRSWVTVKPGQGEFRALAEVSDVSLSVCVSMNARPTVCAFEVVGTEGTIHLDLFHGYAFMESGKVSRGRKMLHPFALALRRLGAATINLSRRALRREPAYPGLQRLVASFYKAVRNGTESPISSEDTIEIANVRDALMLGASLARESKWCQVS